MQKQIIKIFYETFVKEFDFLSNDYGFKGPYSNFKVNEFLYVYEIWYMRENIAVEHYLDWKDQAIDFYISRLEKGTRPEGYLINEKGERIRWRFSSWMREKGINDNQHINLHGLSFSEQIQIKIRDNVRLLREYGKIFLEDKLDAFIEK